ncbi:heparan sulfate sulfotransferase [Aureococcus anophagefferens]|nr:heparan sulfate sulfotransferase [Aureococcus anophagefferens]
MWWSSLPLVALAVASTYGDLNRVDRQRLGFAEKRYAQNPTRVAGDKPRRRKRKAVVDAGDETVCNLKSRAGAKKTGPRFGNLEWRGGAPSAEGPRLGPRTTLVTLVREPVARAYSEYQMKHRRVEGQDAFAGALAEHAAAVLRCVLLVGPRNATRGLRACSPDALTEEPKFPQFSVSVSVQLKKRLAQTQGADGLLGWVRDCFWAEKRSGGDGEPFPADLARRVFFDGTDKFGPERPLVASDVKFDAGECFSDGTRERIGDLDGIMRAEIKYLADCARTNYPRWPAPFPPTGAEAAAYITKCVQIRTGISNQYVYRSLYAAQLHRCVGSGVSRDQLLVLDSDDLRHEPQDVLDVLADHAGIPQHAFDAALLKDADALQASLKEKFPSFENSGWRLESSYTQPMPEKLRSDLARFFGPHNELLYAFAGRRVNWPDR